MSESTDGSFFERERDSFVPTELARGPWGRDTLRGGAIGGGSVIGAGQKRVWIRETHSVVAGEPLTPSPVWRVPPTLRARSRMSAKTACTR